MFLRYAKRGKEKDGVGFLGEASHTKNTHGCGEKIPHTNFTFPWYIFIFFKFHAVWEAEHLINTKTESRRCLWTAMERTPTRQPSVFINFPPLRSRAGWRSWSPPKHRATSTLIGQRRISFPFGFTVIGRLSFSSLETRTETTYWPCTREFWTGNWKTSASNYAKSYF